VYSRYKNHNCKRFQEERDMMEEPPNIIECRTEQIMKSTQRQSQDRDAIAFLKRERKLV
jgi:hypothetical protein